MTDAPPRHGEAEGFMDTTANEKSALTKRDLAVTIAEKYGVSQDRASDIVQTFLNEMLAALKRGMHIEFRDFGVFEILVRKARVGRNPKKPDVMIVIPERKTVKFKPGKMMKLVISKK